MWSLSSKQRTTEGELGYEQLVLEEGALTEEKNHKNVLREANELDANHKCYRTKKRRIFMITQDGEAQGLWLVREILFSVLGLGVPHSFRLLSFLEDCYSYARLNSPLSACVFWLAMVAFFFS